MSVYCKEEKKNKIFCKRLIKILILVEFLLCGINLIQPIIYVMFGVPSPQSWQFSFPTPHMLISNMDIIKFYKVMGYQVLLCITYYLIFFSSCSMVIGLSEYVDACINDFQLSIARFNPVDIKNFQSDLKDSIHLHVDINR